MTDQLHALTALLARARRRRLTQLILEQAGIALGAAFAGAILLLLLGTQILDWYWLVLLFAATFGWGIWRTVRLVPSHYRLAQLIDSRLDFHDTLSTAFVYSSGARRADPDLVEYECAQAEKMARRVDPRTVFPLRVPKALYAVAGVALVAFGMFAIRYGVTHSLDLKPSLVKIAFESVWNTDKAAPPEKKSAFQKKLEEQLKKMGIDLGSPETEQKLDGAPESALETIDTPNVNNADSNESTQAKAANVKERQEPGEGEGSEKGEGSAGNEEPGAGDQPPQAQSNSPGKQDGPQKSANSQSNNEKNSLMDRMRDAMANLLNKLNIQPKGAQNQQSAQNAGQKSGQQKQAQGQKGAQSQGKSDSNSSESPDQQGQQGEGQQSQSAQSRVGDKGADKQASNDSKSGMGKDDGDKTTREAEQLAAMGKISEILGKRAQNLTGELMVEVAGGNQQLKTAYSGKVGSHAEAGGEISRDEVPLMYRDFVQQYFEQIRRVPAPAAAKPKAADAATGKKPSKVTE